MWLINTTTLELKFFQDFKSVPGYAILSHTWGADGQETTFQDMMAKPRTKETMAKMGYKKIEKTCEIAKEWFLLEYAWVDTCCIDKTSSAELSEAINSMYRYYKESSECFAFLSDWSDGKDIKTFDESRWFTRGWTLQELVAPRKMVFFDQGWTQRGTKHSLCDAIDTITGIPVELLQNPDFDLNEIPVAVRMSWAASRETTREEDLAYCLMGLFDINMPMLYGEGSNAFLRLQKKIIKQNPDTSIFAWKDCSNDGFSGVLASAPSLFRDSKNLYRSPGLVPGRLEFSITNQGISLSSPCCSPVKGTGVLFLPLSHSVRKSTSQVGIYVRQAGSSFLRAWPHLMDQADSATKWGLLEPSLFGAYFPKTLSTVQSLAAAGNVVRVWEAQNANNADFELVDIQPQGCWNRFTLTMYAGYERPFLGYLRYTHKGWPKRSNFAIICALTGHGWTCALVPPDLWTKFIGEEHDHRRVQNCLSQMITSMRAEPGRFVDPDHFDQNIHLSHTFQEHTFLRKKTYEGYRYVVYLKQHPVTKGMGCIASSLEVTVTRYIA